MLLLATHLMLTRTRLGRHMYAVGGDREAAEMAGIHVGRVKASALVVCGLLSGVGGLILASRLDSGFGGNGSADLINAIAAAVIGGTSLFGGAGSVMGVVAGSLLVTSIYNGMILMDIGQYWNQVVLGAVILAATVVDQIATGSGPLGASLAQRLRRSRVGAGRGGDRRPCIAPGHRRLKGVRGRPGARRHVVRGGPWRGRRHRRRQRRRQVDVDPLHHRDPPARHRDDRRGRRVVDGLDPDTARRCGIEVVHQQLALVDGMDVISNLFLNRELIAGGFLGRRFGRLARRRMATEAATALGEFGLTIRNLRRPVGEPSGGQRQMLAIVRAVLRDPYFVLMDEPTAALGVEQSRRVQELVLSLKHRGIGVIVVSHRMDQVVEITDRVIVLRHGRKAAELTTSQTNAEELVAYITGARAAISVPAGTDSRDGE